MQNDRAKIKNRHRRIEILCAFVPLCLCAFVPLCLCAFAGCETSPSAINIPSDTANSCKTLSIYAHYTPVKIRIVPLTEFILAGDDNEVSQIKVYVSLLDSFNCQIKTPAVFRFELYQRVPRSAEPKGKRIIIWPDVDLTEPGENNKHWQDFLRAYRFNLDFESVPNQSYILQVTALCPNGRRLSAEFAI